MSAWGLDELSLDLSEAMYEFYPHIVSRARRMRDATTGPNGTELMACLRKFGTRYNLGEERIPVRWVVDALAQEYERDLALYNRLRHTYGGPELVLYPYRPVVFQGPAIDPMTFTPVLCFAGLYAMAPEGK